MGERSIRIEPLDSHQMQTKKLFAGEQWLVCLGLLGFVLAGVCAFYWLRFGAIVPPEGNLHRAFSFNAAIAIYILSIAALMPLSGLSKRGLKTIRWLFIGSICIGYVVETIQHFRGIDPRFSLVGTPVDYVLSTLFGIACITLVIVSVMLGASFFRSRAYSKPSPFIIGTRYAFVSTMFALIGGLIMIGLQSRFVGEGNLIVIHGLGFHALQTLPLIGWLTERTDWNDWKARKVVHWGSLNWILASGFIFIQTMMGHTVFEWTLWPIMAGLSLLVWLIVTTYAMFNFLRTYKNDREICKRTSLITVKVVSNR